MNDNRTQTGQAADALSACAEIAAQQDRERWLAASIAPAPERARLAVLIAFNAEVARTRDVVTEAMLGLIRLQWWRETVSAAAAGTPRAHPVAEGLAALFPEGRVAEADLIALIDARERDLESEGLATLGDFLAYTDATAGMFNRIALELLGVDGESARTAARHVARAVAIAGQLRSVAANAARGRILLPRAFLGGHGVSIAGLLAGRPEANLAAAARELAAIALGNLAAARAMRAEVPRAALPVLATARFAGHHLKRLEKARYDLFGGTLEAAPLSAPLAVLAALVTGRY